MALISWCRLHQKKHPELGLLIHLPLGGKRNAREAARLKRMGVRAGVSDYLLPVVIGKCTRNQIGLWLELKAGAGKPTPSQMEWHRLMREQGYATVVATGWVEAAQAICDYLGLTGSVRP